MTYGGDDEFSSEQTHSGKSTIGDERQRRQGVDGGVNVRQSLQAFQVASPAIPERAMSAERNLDGTKRPPQHLVQPIGQIDGR